MESEAPHPTPLSDADAILIQHFAQRTRLTLAQLTHMLHQALADHLRTHHGHILFPLRVGLPSPECTQCTLCFQIHLTPNIISGQF